MRYHRLLVPVLIALTVVALAPGCGHKNDVIPQQVSQRLTELQQKMNLTKAPPPSPTANVFNQDLPTWQKFTIKDRELFKPLETSELSEGKVVIDAYHVQLKGIVLIGKKPKAIVAVNDQSYWVDIGQTVTADVILKDIHDDGVDIQRSYKKVYLSVGEKQDI